MATKPSVTFTFATDLNFSSGVASGQPTKIAAPTPAQGFVPDTGIIPEYVNNVFNILGDWTGWLDSGTSAAATEARIVETDANGEAFIAAVDLGGTAFANAALTVNENTAQTITSIFNNSVSGGTAITVNATDVGGFGSAVSINQFGIGTGVSIVSGGVGLSVSADNQQPGIRAFGSTTGTGGAGVVATGGGTDGHGVVATATGSAAAGGTFTCDPQSTRAPIEAAFGAAGTPRRGALALGSQAQPSSPNEGDIWVRGGTAGFGRGGVEYYDDDGASGGGAGGKQRLWSTSNGLGIHIDEALGDQTDDTGVLQTALLTTLDTSGSPGNPEGRYIVQMFATARLSPGTATTTRARVEFWVGGVLVNRQDFDFAVTSQQKPAFYLTEVNLGGSPVNLEIRFETLTATEEVAISDCRIVCQGAYE